MDRFLANRDLVCIFRFSSHCEMLFRHRSLPLITSLVFRRCSGDSPASGHCTEASDNLGVQVQEQLGKPSLPGREAVGVA